MKIVIIVCVICAAVDTFVLYCLARAGGKDDERNGRK